MTVKVYQNVQITINSNTPHHAIVKKDAIQLIIGIIAMHIIL